MPLVARAAASVSLSPSTTVVAAARLRRTKDIAAVRANGSTRSDPHFTLRASPNDAGAVRVAVSATRELGTAVRRNRARRRLREAVRLELLSRPTVPSVDLVLAARKRSHDAVAADLRAAVANALDGVLRS